MEYLIKKVSIFFVMIFTILGCTVEKPGLDKTGDATITSEFPMWSDNIQIIADKELEIGTDDFNNDDHYLSLISDIETDNNSRIYILDGKAFRVQIYSDKGEFEKSIPLRKGQGPGDFLRPKCMAVDSNCHIYIGDMNAKRVTIFSQNGEYINSFKTEVQPADIEVNSKGDIYLTAFFDYSKNRIHKYNSSSGEAIKSFCPWTVHTKEVATFGESDKIFIDSNDQLYFSSFFPYEIRIYSSEDILIKSISRKSELHEARLDRDPLTKAINFVIGCMDIIVLSDGTIINGIKSRDLDKSEGYFDFDIFSPEGEWLCSFSSKVFRLDWIRILTIDSNDYIYVDRSSPFPQVLKFSIKFNDINVK